MSSIEVEASVLRNGEVRLGDISMHTDGVGTTLSVTLHIPIESVMEGDFYEASDSLIEACLKVVSAMRNEHG